MQQYLAEDLRLTSQTELLQAVIPTLRDREYRIRELGDRRPLLVQSLRFVRRHPLTKFEHLVGVRLLTRVRIGALLSQPVLAVNRSVNVDAVLLHGRDFVYRREATVYQILLRFLAVTLFDVLVHGSHLAAVAALIYHARRHDQPRLVGRGELHIERRPKASVSHLHVASLGVGSRCAGLFSVTLLPLLLLFLELDQFFQSPIDTPRPVFGRTLTGRLLTRRTLRSIRLRLAFGLQFRDALLRFLTTLLERLPATEGTGSGAGPHTHAVLREHVQRDQPLMQPRRDGVGEQFIKDVDMLRAEVAEQVIIDTHAAADPLVRRVSRAELRDPASTADTFTRGKHPQSQQNSRISMIPSRLALNGPNLLVKRREIKRFNIRPDITSLMFQRQHLIERQRPYFDLAPFGPSHASLSTLRCLMSIHYPLVARSPPSGQAILHAIFKKITASPINIFHSVENIVAISLAAIIAGAEGPKPMARWAKNKKDWLATWLDLPAGKTPRRDCIRTFFARVDPTAFQACFFAWLDGLAGNSKQSNGLRIVAIDGKSLRHSFDTRKKLRPLHLVSAWVAECHISLGQVATEEKSNEITAIPELLDQIDIEDAIVTIDAMGCQKEIARKITSQKGKFVIAVKGNQPTLYHTIESFFEDHWADGDWSKGRCHRHHTRELTGSRQDDRYYYVAPIPRRAKVFGDWPSVKAIGMVIRVRQEGDEVTEEVRYYILSEDLTGKDFARAVRQHWSIENNCHWQLDVLFHEDASRVRERTLTNNLSWMRRVAISLLKHHPSTDSLKGKRQNAGWNDHFLAEVLQIQH